MESLKIAFFAWESLYSEKVGGLAVAATNLAETLASRHEMHYFTRGIGDEEINGVQYHYVSPQGGNIIDYCSNMSQLAVNKFDTLDSPRFDILHFHDWHFVEALHRLKDRDTVMTYHSTEYGRNGNKFGKWWEFREISGKEWYGGLIAKRVTAVSSTLKKEVNRIYNVPEWKVDVVYNGIHPDQYLADVDPGEIKSQYGVHPYAPLVFFGGRLSVQKGPDLLLAAVPEILKHRWDAQFIFAGDGDMRHFLKRRAGKFPVNILGYLPDNEFVNLLNASDIVVIPSRNEPFGLILTEAWSAERCVVACNVGGLSENIDHFENGIKVDVTPDSIAWGVNFVINDNKTIRNFGRKGREKVDKKFRWERIAKKMERSYRRVLG